MTDASRHYMSWSRFYYVKARKFSMSSAAQLLLTQLVTILGRSVGELGEQLIDLGGGLLDLLDRLAHAPSREPYHRVRGVLILLVALSVVWVSLVYVARMPIPALPELNLTGLFGLSALG